jgi:multidrug efflux pump subunit AcrB
MWTLLVAGVYCGLTMQREFFPQTDPDRARVVMPFPGATPQEIEESIARKVEDAIAELREVRKIETVIGEGLGVSIVEFRDGVNLREGMDEVQDAIDSLQDLPPDAEPIRLSKLEPNLPVIMIALHGHASEEAMKDSMRQLADELRTLPGMGTLVLSGLRGYEIQVDVSGVAIIKHGLSLPRVADAVTSWMIDVPGGTVRAETGNMSVRTVGVEEKAEAIREIVIKATEDGQSLRLGEIATVREHFVDDQVQRRFNGEPSLALTVFKTGDQDAIDIARMVKAYVAGRTGEPFPGTTLDRVLRPERLRAWELGRDNPRALPGALELHSDLSRLIEGRLRLLMDNALQGGALILLVLLLFLNPRVAFWVLVGLITALCGTLVAMTALGVTLNLLTMFGLLIVLGMLEDDAIVVSENIVACHDRGDPPVMAAIRGAEQVFWPVVATVLTTIVAFLPLMVIRGPVGDLLAALPLVVLCALSISLVETMMIMPSHLAHSLEAKARQTPGRLERIADRFCAWRDGEVVRRIAERYGRMMAWTLHHRYLTASMALAVMIVSIGMVAGGRLPFTFLPKNDSETIVCDLRLPIGAPLARTEEVVRRFERTAEAIPEVRSISVIVGESADLETALTNAPATHVAQLFIELKPVEERERSSSEVISSIRGAVGPLPEVESIRFQEISGGPAGPDVTVEVQGEEREPVLDAVTRVSALLRSFEGLRDVADDDEASQPELRVLLRPAAAGMGFTVLDVARQVRASLFGIDAHVFSDRREDIDVRIRLAESARRRLDAIENLWISAPDGRAVPLGEVATLEDGSSFATIRRVDRQRTISVFADCEPGVNPEAVAEGIAPGLAAIEAAVPGVRVRTGGRAQDLRDAMASLPIAFGAAMLMIYVIVAWLFSSYVQPFAVMLAIPFSIVGVVWGHLAMGFQLDFLSLIGFVALSGVVVNNSLVFVEFQNDLRRQGLQLREALIGAGRARLRAIVLTSLTTFVGLAPLMLEQSFQARFLIPMAIAISFGLLSATLLTLVVLPCMLVIFDDVAKAATWLWTGGRSGGVTPPSRSAEE